MTGHSLNGPTGRGNSDLDPVVILVASTNILERRRSWIGSVQGRSTECEVDTDWDSGKSCAHGVESGCGVAMSSEIN